LKVNIYTISLILLISEFLFSQQTSWYKEYGSVHYFESLIQVIQTSDGGYFAVGNRYPYSSGVLLRTDSLGNELWSKSIWHPQTDIYINSFDTTLDSAYIFICNNSYIVKTDLQGSTLWDKNIGVNITGRSIKQITTGGFIIAGAGANNIGGFLLKTNDNGDSLWTRTFSYLAYSVCETSDSGFALTGKYGLRTFLLKADSEGNQLWVRFFGSVDDYHLAYSIQETFDGGFVFAGSASFSASEKYVFIIKTDKYGNLEFRKYFSIDESYGYWIDQTLDSGYVITGYNDAEYPQKDEIYAIRINQSGNTIWEKVYNPEDHHVKGNCIQQSFDGVSLLADMQEH